MKLEKDTVSVVIPSYNHQDYVLQAVQSVLQQDWPQIDLIVIDDGSPDQSYKILTNYLQKEGRFRLISRANKGLVKTVNEGLSLAKGEFFCLLASDDYLPLNSLSARASYLSKHQDCVAVFGDAQHLSDEPEASHFVMDEKRRRLFKKKDPIPDFLNGINLPIHTLMARTEEFRSIGGFDERYQYCEDLDPQLLLYLAGPIHFVDVPVYYNRHHDTNSSRINPSVARADKVLLYLKYLEEIPQLAPYRKIIKYRLRRQYLLLGRYLSKATSPSSLEKKLFQGAWKYCWQDIRLLWHFMTWTLQQK